MDSEDLINLGIALGLGLLAGLQREHADSRVAGIRTFSLIALFGAISGMVAEHFGNMLIIGIALFCLTLMLFMANYMKTRSEHLDVGQTTEVAAMLMFLLSAYVIVGSKAVAVVVGGMVAVLLYLKKSMANFTGRLGEKDLRAIFQFAALSLIILPILPDAEFGPYSVLNPREIWLMVVLIVGLGVGGYFAYKWLGKNVGTVMSGILGGLISSTATTLTYSRRSKESPDASRLAAFIIMAASTVSFLRVIVEVAIVSPRHLATIAPPLATMTLLMALISTGLYFFKKENDQGEIPEPDNPAQLKSALFFGLLYAVIVFAVAVVKDYFGAKGLYAVSILSGLTDMDAITLSLANTINGGGLEASRGWRLILTAALSNMVFKGGMAVFIGDRQLKQWLLGAFGLSLVLGLLILLLWGALFE
jgi:uncharacterized membrane protein (DUF4010 family)